MSQPQPTDAAHELAQLEALRDPTLDQAGQSARDFRRYVIRGEATLYPVSRRKLDDAGTPVHLRDISRGGMGFICDRPLPQGSDWRIIFLHNGYAVAENCICVRHVRLVRPGIHLIGTNFVAAAGLLTLLGVDAGSLENEYAGAAHPPSQAA